MRSRSMIVFAALWLIVPNAFAKGLCDLLTPAEASVILGASTQPGKLMGAAACVFSVTSKEDMAVSVLDPAGSLPASFVEGVIPRTANRISIPGLGEKAYYSVRDGNHGILAILMNNTIVMLEARGGRKEGLQDALVNTAKKVMSRL
jgi:hypothetical protein